MQASKDEIRRKGTGCEAAVRVCSQQGTKGSKLSAGELEDPGRWEAEIKI